MAACFLARNGQGWTVGVALTSACHTGRYSSEEVNGEDGELDELHC